MRHAVTRAVLLGAALTFAAAACSSSSSSDGAKDTKSTTTAEAKTTTTEAPTTTATPTTTTATATDDKVQAFVEQQLITPNDIGIEGFTSSTPSQSAAAPCGLKLDDEHPPEAKAAVFLANDQLQLGVQEAIRVYPTIKDAQQAFNDIIGPSGLGCGKSTDGSITIGKGLDVSSELTPAGAKLTAAGYQLKSDEQVGSAFVVVYSDSLVTFQFGASTSASQSASTPNPLDVAKAGIAKLVAAAPEN
jgi:hypothetical protein